MSIEDNYDDLNYINGVFALNGFKCFKYLTAEQALENLEEHKEKVDSMLIDGKIAVDRGAKIIVKSKIKKPEIKIIVVANNGGIRTRVLEYGADDFMPKPVSAEVLTNRIITQLAKRS